MPRPRSDPATILVYVGWDRIGDGLMKLPFLRALRSAYPTARITWLAGKGPTAFGDKLKPLTEGLIDEILEDAGIGNAWHELLGRPLEGRRFDLVLDTQRRVLTTLILRRIAHGRFISGCAGYLLSDTRPKGALTGAYRKPAAMIDQMLEIVALAHGGRPDAPLEFGSEPALPEPVVAEATRLLPGNDPLVALAPGASLRFKCWPLDRFMALGNRLAKQGLVPVFLLGPQESEWLAPLRAAVPGARFPLAEPGALLELEPLLTIGLAARCRACVANDSGGGHLFAASGTPLVSLFGPTSPEKFLPRTPKLILIEASTFGAQDMEGIPVEAVEKAVTRAASGSFRPQ